MGNESAKEQHVHILLSNSSLPCPFLSPSETLVMAAILKICYNWKANSNFFVFYFILLYNTVLVLPNIDMNQPRVYMSSQSWTPFLPPTPYHLSGSSRAPAPSILYPVSNIDWRFVSYLIVYMFQCHSPEPSHPQPLPQSPKDCSTHLCLFCGLA